MGASRGGAAPAPSFASATGASKCCAGAPSIRTSATSRARASGRSNRLGRMTADADGTPVEAITVDTLLRGRVTLLQPARGFRSSVDPLLLSAFVRPPFGRFVDIGCGTGTLAFSLAALDAMATGVAVELQ